MLGQQNILSASLGLSVLSAGHVSEEGPLALGCLPVLLKASGPVAEGPSTSRHLVLELQRQFPSPAFWEGRGELWSASEGCTVAQTLFEGLWLQDPPWPYFLWRAE